MHTCMNDDEMKEEYHGSFVNLNLLVFFLPMWNLLNNYVAIEFPYNRETSVRIPGYT